MTSWLGKRFNNFHNFLIVQSIYIYSGFLDEDGLVHDINYQNIIEPFYINIAINMNNSYAPAYKNEPFKYQITILMSKLILNTSPDMVRDMMQLSQYTEMYSYY